MVEYHGLKYSYKNKQLPSITRELHVSLSISNYTYKMQPEGKFQIILGRFVIDPTPDDGKNKVDAIQTPDVLFGFFNKKLD